MTPFADLFLTSSGRIGRIAFIIGAGAVLAAWAAFDRLAPLQARDLVGWVVVAALLYSAACLLSQRLHDRGRSGWWSGPILLAVVLAWPKPQTPLDWVAAAALVLVAVDLLLPGQARFNRYGAAPGARGQAKAQMGATPG